jgi:hypothetical protein
MDTSNYLPPFTREQRAAVAGGKRTTVKAGVGIPDAMDHEATYADFLGDEVDPSGA